MAGWDSEAKSEESLPKNKNCNSFNPERERVRKPQEYLSENILQLLLHFLKLSLFNL